MGSKRVCICKYVLQRKICLASVLLLYPALRCFFVVGLSSPFEKEMKSFPFLQDFFVFIKFGQTAIIHLLRCGLWCLWLPSEEGQPPLHDVPSCAVKDVLVVHPIPDSIQAVLTQRHAIESLRAKEFGILSWGGGEGRQEGLGYPLDSSRHSPFIIKAKQVLHQPPKGLSLHLHGSELLGCQFAQT